LRFWTAGANIYIQMPAKAWVITVAVTSLLFIAAVVAIAVCALVFPEYCVDEVGRPGGIGQGCVSRGTACVLMHAQQQSSC
jgi:hypothetical protein